MKEDNRNPLEKRHEEPTGEGDFEERTIDHHGVPYTFRTYGGERLILIADTYTRVDVSPLSTIDYTNHVYVRIQGGGCHEYAWKMDAEGNHYVDIFLRES